jgi:uncharacterized membrane protein HdeD (DUF308 family)
VIIAALGFIDIVIGIVLVLGGLPVFRGNWVAAVLGVAIIVKGIWSWLNNLAAGMKLDFMGILDIVAGILVLALSGGGYLFFFAYFGIMEIIKGIYSFVVGLVK